MRCGMWHVGLGIMCKVLMWVGSYRAILYICIQQTIAQHVLSLS